MTERQLEERLRLWHAAEADSGPTPPTLPMVLDKVLDGPRIARPSSPWRLAGLPAPLILVVVALLLGAALVGAVAVGSSILESDRTPAAFLDPATLDPCEVVPGAGPVPAKQEPRRHAGAAVVRGDSCPYGWDDGSNPHFQLRDRYTTSAEAAAIAADLFEGDASQPLSLMVDGHLAWMGLAKDNPAASNAPDCLALAVSSHPYFFVVWFTCPHDPPVTAPDLTDESQREAMVAIAHGALANLEALNAGRAPRYVYRGAP